MLEHLMYKALFETSKRSRRFRVASVSKRRRAGRKFQHQSIFTRFVRESNPQLYQESLAAIIDQLANRTNSGLSQADKTTIGAFLNTFRSSGPARLKGPATKSHLFASDDWSRSDGPCAKLSGLESFKFVQDLQKLYSRA
jgi:hypothetical protein